MLVMARLSRTFCKVCILSLLIALTRQQLERWPPHRGALSGCHLLKHNIEHQPVHSAAIKLFPFKCRFPFLLVDRVIEVEYGKYAVGYKNVTVNDNFFPGHFPDRPIMPGRWLMEESVAV